MDPLETLKAQRDELLTRAEAILTSGEQSDATEANLQAIHAEVGELNARIEQFVKVSEMRSAADSLDLRGARSARESGDNDAQRGAADLGGMFTDSDQYRSWLNTGGKSGVFLASGDPCLLNRAALLTTDLDGIYPQPSRVTQSTPSIMLPLTSLATRIPVSSNAVEWVVEGGDPAAVVTAEGTAKTEGSISSAVSTITLDTVATWAQASRQLLEDSTAAREFINRKQANGVAKKIEANIAAALVAATLPTATVPVGGKLVEAIRVGIGTVQAAGYSPDAIVVNPADYAQMDIDVMGGTLNGPVVRPSYWGLAVVASNTQPAGTATVGSFSDGLTLLTRDSIATYISDSHADTFTSNIFTILTEARAKSVVGPTDAFAECSVALA